MVSGCHLAQFHVVIGKEFYLEIKNYGKRISNKLQFLSQKKKKTSI